jgi:hypothetical protein
VCVVIRSCCGASWRGRVSPYESPTTEKLCNDLAVQASVSLQSALEDVRSAANVAIEKLQSLAQEPDEVEIEFGIRLNAQAGAVIAKTEAEGHLKVRITWKKSG